MRRSCDTCGFDESTLSYEFKSSEVPCATCEKYSNWTEKRVNPSPKDGLLCSSHGIGLKCIMRGCYLECGKKPCLIIQPT